jgi:hypothetical protein
MRLLEKTLELVRGFKEASIFINLFDYTQPKIFKNQRFKVQIQFFMHSKNIHLVIRAL